MKTRSLSTILMSAYLSAMLASCLAPMAGNITLAGTVNPGAAQAAFREALIGANTSGWAVAAVNTPAAPEPKIVVARSTPPAEPIITDELLARLLKRISEQQKPATIPAGVCAHFKLCDGTAKLPMRMVQTTNPGGDYMAQAWEGHPDAIVVARKMPDGSVHFYLTDKNTRKLLAAASSVSGVATVIEISVATPNYEAALAHLGKEAADLPPANVVAAAGS